MPDYVEKIEGTFFPALWDIYEPIETKVTPFTLSVAEGKLAAYIDKDVEIEADEALRLLQEKIAPVLAALSVQERHYVWLSISGTL